MSVWYMCSNKNKYLYYHCKHFNLVPCRSTCVYNLGVGVWSNCNPLLDWWLLLHLSSTSLTCVVYHSFISVSGESSSYHSTITHGTHTTHTHNTHTHAHYACTPPARTTHTRTHTTRMWSHTHTHTIIRAHDHTRSHTHTPSHAHTSLHTHASHTHAHATTHDHTRIQTRSHTHTYGVRRCFRQNVILLAGLGLVWVLRRQRVAVPEVVIVVPWCYGDGGGSGSRWCSFPYW